MTYADLLQTLSRATAEQLAQDVTVYVSGVDEFYAVVHDFPVCEANDECDALDAGHLYLVI